LAAGLPASERSDAAFVSAVDGGCADVLAPLNSLPASAVNTSALRTFGEEIGGDVGVAFVDQKVYKSFARLAAALSNLQWSSPETSQTITAFIKSEEATLRLTPSDLCADARAVAANPEATPAPTERWVVTLNEDYAASRSRLNGFLHILSRFQTKADVGVIASINRLATLVNSSQLSTRNTDASEILSDLGLAT
jgi:hypothetical protein